MCSRDDDGGAKFTVDLKNFQEIFDACKKTKEDKNLKSGDWSSKLF